MESNEYRTSNPLTANPIDCLDETVDSLEFLAGALEQTATEDIDLMLVASRQRGLAHILDTLRWIDTPVPGSSKDIETRYWSRCRWSGTPLGLSGTLKSSTT